MIKEVYITNTIRTLIVRSPERQIVRDLIVRLPKHQQRNVNLQKGHSTASPMIKSTKNAEREKRIGVVRIAFLPQWGIFRLIGFGSRKPSFLLGVGFYLLLV